MSLKDAEPGDWLLLQNEISGIGEILRLVSELKVNIVLNSAPIKSQALGLPISTIKWLVVNEVKGEMLSGQKHPDKIVDTILVRYPDLSYSDF